MIIQQNLGTLPPTSTLISTGVATAGVVSAATGATAGLLAAVGIGAQAVPIVGTIIGAVALAIGALGIGNGCGGTCTEATQVVNQAEPLLKQNLAAAQAQAVANGGCLTSAELSTAIANFNSVWSQVVANCQKIPAPGGTQCISDRSPGGKYDWTSYYLTPLNAIPVCSTASASSVSNPVSNTGNVVVDSVSNAVSSVATSIGISSEVLWLGAVGLAAFLLMRGKSGD